MTRTIHATAIILALSPLAAVVGWLVIIALSLIALMGGMVVFINDVVDWLDGLEAEGL
jgi:hypothetical protein